MAGISEARRGNMRLWLVQNALSVTTVLSSTLAPPALFDTAPYPALNKEQSCKPDAATSPATASHTPDFQPRDAPETDDSIQDAPPLAPLTSLKWPYVPEESSFPDPLKRDDPKTLQPRHYEAIATSKAIRTTLLSNPSLKPLLKSLDSLRGVDREKALQRALGVTPPDIRASSSSTFSGRPTRDGATQVSTELPGVYVTDEQTKILRELAEAVEACVRDPEKGGRGGVELGLDWEAADAETSRGV